MCTLMCSVVGTKGLLIVKSAECKLVNNIRVIPGEINKEFRLTFRILTKFGMLIAYIEVITHTKF